MPGVHLPPGVLTIRSALRKELKARGVGEKELRLVTDSFTIAALAAEASALKTSAALAIRAEQRPLLTAAELADRAERRIDEARVRTKKMGTHPTLYGFPCDRKNGGPR